MLDEDGRRMMKAGVRLSAVGFEIAICLLLGYFGGSWLDGVLDTRPYVTIFGGLAGLAAAAKVVIRVAKETDLDKL